MTQPKRPDEIALYARLRAIGAQPGRLAIEQAARDLRIAPRRVEYLLLKWTANGWWNWGVNPFAGWFEDDAPVELRP